MIEAVASETGLAKTEVAKVLNAYTNTIVKTVAGGGEYTVIGFGKFYASQRQARTGRNPSTGVEIKIPAAMVPKFSAGKAFKDAVNAPKKPARKEISRSVILKPGRSCRVLFFSLRTIHSSQLVGYVRPILAFKSLL